MENKYYSQNDEEEVLLRLFNRLGISQGRFLDIGAYDGKAFSNTLRLVELGWSGVCVEPSPSVFPALLNLHGKNPAIQLVNAAVGARAQLIDFYDSGGDAISTTSVRHAEKWQQGWKVNYRKFQVYTIPLSVLLSQHGLDFQFINIDVEDANLELFELLPLNLLSKNKVICVEHDGHVEKMLNLAIPYGYHQEHLNGENLILAR